MRIGAIVVACFVLAGAAYADPITLSCSGSFMEGYRESLKSDRQTAVLDLENRSFKPPLYEALPLTLVGDAEVSFAKETSDLSVRGSLDRVSGTLFVNVMRPNERKKLEVGEGGYVTLNWITAKCVPAQRMF